MCFFSAFHVLVRVATVTGLLALSSCAPGYEIEVRGTLVGAMGIDGPTGPDLYGALLIETSPGVYTQFYISPQTEFANIDRVDGRIDWLFGNTYLVRGNKSQRHDPRRIAGISETEIQTRIDATYVQYLASGL